VGGVKLAIVGSTSLRDNPEALAIIHSVIDEILCENGGQDLTIISGGAAGIDAMAEEEAGRRGLRTLIFRPRIRRWDGPGGFQERNLQIAETCDRLVRIVVRGSKTYGSGWTRDRARELGKATEEFVVG
jgi:hypothetical protein